MGFALTWILLIQFRTAVKLHSAVTSYITKMPSAFRKYCFVMLRNLKANKRRLTEPALLLTRKHKIPHS